MTTEAAQKRAALLGLSVWQAEVVPVGGDTSEFVLLKCVGFAAIDVPMAEAETWEQALDQAARFIFRA